MVLILFCAIGLSACSAAASLPAAGEWAAKAEFGKVTFTINSDSTMILSAVFTFDKYQCGPGTSSGSIQVTYNNGLKIANGEIKLSLQNSISAPVVPNPANPIPPSSNTQVVTLTGKFSSDGKAASGTWNGTYNGKECAQGKWDAAPNK